MLRLTLGPVKKLVKSIALVGKFFFVDFNSQKSEARHPMGPY